MKKERKKYEQKYLSRYKQPKTKKVASSDLYKPEIPKPKLDMKKERKEYEQKYLSRYKQPKTKKNVGSDLYKPEIPKPKRNMRKERKEYEQKYLSRYKQPKSGVKKSTSWTQHDVALGRLTLSPHFNAKRRAKQDEIREYEQKYLSRYKEPKPKKSIGSDLYKPEIPKPKLDMKKERKKYEQKYLSRYKQPKSGVKKSSSWTQHDVALGRLTLSPHFNAKRRVKQDEIREYEKQYLSRYKQPKTKKRAIQLEWEPEPKQNIKKERKDYENEFLTRYKKQQKAKPKKKVSKLLTPEPKIDRKKERKKYEKEYLSRLKNNL